jgi:IclR family transcriptional regulator, KDG regulon repressor
MAVGEGPLESRRRSGASGAVLSSVGNAARVLKEFGNGVDELGITELSRRIGIGKSTAHRIVSTLVEEKLLERTAGSGRYHLAVSMFDLGAAVPIRRQLYEASHSVLDALRARSHTAALIAVRSGRETYFLARAESDEAVALLRPVGNRV